MVRSRTKQNMLGTVLKLSPLSLCLVKHHEVKKYGENGRKAQYLHYMEVSVFKLPLRSR